ncbi:MAG TPA: organomercurial lyase [Acidimicrobiales bacterium]
MSERVIADDAQAATAAMSGSPTILVDGVDLFPAEVAVPSVSCRLYPSQAGTEGAPTVDALIDALAKRRFRPANMIDDVSCAPRAGPTAPATGRHVRVNGFVALWRGERLNVADLTDDTAAVEALVQAGRLEIDDHGVVVGVHGLAARPTAHRVEHADGVVHTWCALDAIGIPAALALDAAALTTCPACGTALRVTLDGGVPAVDEDMRLWLPGGQCTHLVEDFCRHANLYCTADHVASKVAPGTPGSAVTVADAAGIGRVEWADVSAVLRAA